MSTETFAQEVASTQRLQTVNYMIVASITILIYDYFLTFTSEVKYIWNTKFNIIKALYLLSRYPAFFDVSISLSLAVKPYFNLRVCGPISDVSAWSTLVGITFAELILVIRTTAIWGKSRRVLYGLSFLTACVFVSSVVIANIYLRSITPSDPPFPAIYGCNLAGGSPIVFLNFVLLMVLETVIVVMTTYRVYKKFRNSTDPTIVTLYRDGVLFFVALFVIGLVNILVLALGPVDYQNLIITLQRCMHSILSCRIILHVRESNYERATTFQSSNIEFAARIGTIPNDVTVSETGEIIVDHQDMNPVDRAVEMLALPHL